MNKINKVELKPCSFCGEKFQLEYVEVDRKNPDRDIIKCRICESRARRKYWNKSHNELVELDEEAIVISFERFLEPHTCGWKIKQFYIDNGHYFKSWISEICAKFGQRQTEDVGEIIKFSLDWVSLHLNRSKYWNPETEIEDFHGILFMSDFQQALLKFKEKKD